MFVCTFEDFFGMGETCLDAYNALVSNMETESDGGSVSPEDCDFFARVDVEITETRTWGINPDWDSL